MILYHGTNVDFDRIDLLKSKPNKDFGRGFYLSANNSIFFWYRTGYKYITKNMNEAIEMKAYMVNRLAMMLLEHNQEMSMEQALGVVFNSDTYQKIMNDKTRFYYQSPLYVFAYLDQELKEGKIN